MRERANLRDLAEKVNPDFVGFIFYPETARYFLDGTEEIPEKIAPEKRVGVFVNAPIAEVTGLAKMFQIKNIQLHGHETPEYCRKIMDAGYMVVKAFGISGVADLKKVEAYQHACHYFLFDTKTENHGGSGKKFDWKILDQYKFQKPFFLSGGIDAANVHEISDLKTKPYAIDINSRFELSPGVKDIVKIELFKSNLLQHAKIT